MTQSTAGIPCYPVNSNGELVFKQGTGNTTVVGNIPLGQIPADLATGEIAAVFDGLVTNSPGPKKIIAIGDSLVDYGDKFGRVFADPTTLNFAIVKSATLATPTSGPGTLTWSRENSTLQWTAPGDTIGAPVKVTSGVFVLPSGTPGYELTVGCKSFTMAATPSGSETIAYLSTSWIKNLGGFMHMVNTFTGQRFKVLRNFGISGISAFEIAGAMYQQAINSGADIIVDNAGTNDIQLRGKSPAEVAASRIACWQQAGAAGKQVIGMGLSPRWGRDAAGGATGNYTDNTKYSTTLQANIVATNTLLQAAAKTMPWVRYVDVYQNTTDVTQTDGRVRNGYTKDGLHDSGGLAYERALIISRILDTMYPDDRARVNVGAGAYYDAVLNPGGNLLTSNQGAFVGTTGTVGTGVTAGTGVATGFNSARNGGGTVVATANKVAATDGGQDWQELVISGATANNEVIGFYFGNTPSTRFTAGTDVVEFSVEFKVIGTGCAGVYADIFMNGQTFHPSAFSLQQIVQGLRDGQGGVLATEPIQIQTGTTSMGPRLYIASNAGASFTIRFRTADLRKIL